MAHTLKNKIRKAFICGSAILTNRIVRPKHFVLTGLPRSGTSLLSKLLCNPLDCFCFNEIHYDLPTLPQFFNVQEAKLLRGDPVPNKVDKSGELSSDTTENLTHVSEKAFPRKTHPLKIGSNVNIPYLDLMPLVMAYRYKVLIMIRNPVYTLGSWSSEKTARFSEARVTDDDLDPRWKKFEFRSADSLERRAQIWEHYARIVYAHRHRCLVVRYEDLTTHLHPTLERVFDYLEIHHRPVLPDLQNLNIDSRYRHTEMIKDAVRKCCPTRMHFGY